MRVSDTDTPTGRGMAAIDHRARQQAERRNARARVAATCLDAQQLQERIDEEVGRASRHRTSLCCLLVRIDDFEQISQTHGRQLAERALLHAGEALSVELRRFDRVGRPSENELIVVLPGANDQQGESVARRALARLRSIKIEIGRVRRPLCLSVGIATWRAPWSAQRLIDEARAAASTPVWASED